MGEVLQKVFQWKTFIKKIIAQFLLFYLKYFLFDYNKIKISNIISIIIHFININCINYIELYPNLTTQTLKNSILITWKLSSTGNCLELSGGKIILHSCRNFHWGCPKDDFKSTDFFKCKYFNFYQFF